MTWILVRRVLYHDLPCARWVHAATTHAAHHSPGLETRHHGLAFIPDRPHARQPVILLSYPRRTRTQRVFMSACLQSPLNRRTASRRHVTWAAVCTITLTFVGFRTYYTVLNGSTPS